MLQPLPEVTIKNLSYSFNILSAAPRGNYKEFIIKF